MHLNDHSRQDEFVYCNSHQLIKDNTHISSELKYGGLVGKEVIIYLKLVSHKLCIADCGQR